jgi:uncharacterized protein YdeI (YjbR/CyaY-like superfamily)
MAARFFASAAAWRAWLEHHHAKAAELVVGFHKRATGKRCMTWPESVDEALCFGWIDGKRQSLGDEAYSIRFTRRKPTSIWSAINVAKVAALRAAGKMRAAGEAAFALRSEARTGVYSFERAQAAVLTAGEDALLAANPEALAYWNARPPGYRKTACHWVVSAKRPETRAKRLATLIADCAAGRTIKPLTRPATRAPRPRRRRARA